MSEQDFFIDAEMLPEDDERDNHPSLKTIILSLIVLIALLATLVWPLLRSPSPQRPPPTPTSTFLREA